MTEAAIARRQVIQRELEWHEQESHRRYGLDALLYDSPAFDEIVQRTIDFLQVEPGELILDMGCGEGKEVLELLAQDLVVIGTDLSYSQLQRTRTLVKKEFPAKRLFLIQANAEQLPFANHSFRFIHGKAILHHLDLDIAAGETNRLLSLSGRATFAEPMAEHFIIRLGRLLTPNLRTDDERPMAIDELKHFGRMFNNPDLQAYYLTTPLAYPFRLIPGGEKIFASIYSMLSRLDRKLLSRFKYLRRFAWYGVLNIQTADR